MSGRDRLIFEDALRDERARAVFEHTVEQVNDGTAVVRKLAGESIQGFIVEGQKVLGSAVLEFFLGTGSADEFQSASAQVFSEKMRALLGWHEISYTLRLWAERRICKPYFTNVGSEWDQRWVLREGADLAQVPAEFLTFACYIAIGELKHGPSYASVSAHRIFDWVAALGSDLPAKLKKHGTGHLSPDLADFRGVGVSAKANDALAVTRIALREESEHAYRQTLEYLIRLLTESDFPRTYSLEFRGTIKTYLPIKGLPKKGVHQLFACASAYPALHPLIEAYARAAMREYEWYASLEDENCAMPGTFAVFALAFASPAYAPLVLDYLCLVDGEHQSMHGKFVEAYVDAHGFTPEALAYLIACAGNIQHLRHRKIYPPLIANRAALETLLELRATRQSSAPSAIVALRANLVGDTDDDPGFRAARYTIWGDLVERQRGEKLVAAASEDLRPLYEEIFNDERR